MPDLCRVRGTVIDPKHLPLGGATIQFSIQPQVVQPSRNGEDVLAPKLVVTTLDHLGQVEVDLEPGPYRVTIALSQRNPFPSFNISVPDALTANIADIQSLPAPAPPYMDEVRDALRGVEEVRRDVERVVEISERVADLSERVSLLATVSLTDGDDGTFTLTAPETALVDDQTTATWRGIQLPAFSLTIGV